MLFVYYKKHVYASTHRKWGSVSCPYLSSFTSYSQHLAYFFCLHIVYVLQSATILEEQQDNTATAYNQGYKYLHFQHFSVATTMRIQTVHKTTADLLTFFAVLQNRLSNLVASALQKNCERRCVTCHETRQALSKNGFLPMRHSNYGHNYKHGI